MSTALDIAKTKREGRRRRQGKSTRASSKTVSLPDAIVEDLEAELEAFQRQMSRWQKLLSREDFTGQLLSEEGYTDDQPAEVEVTA